MTHVRLKRSAGKFSSFGQLVEYSMNAPAYVFRCAQRRRTMASMIALAAGVFFALGYSNAAMAERSVVTCQPTKVKTIVSDTFRSTTSTTFVSLEEAGGTFTQKGTRPGCVLVRFEGYVASYTNTVMTISATIDGEAIAPSELQFTMDVVYLPSEWTFIIPNVAPGKHRIAIQFRGNNGNAVSVNKTSTIIQYQG